MDAAEFTQFRHDSVHALMRLNEACDKAFNISSWPRWDYDLDAGTLIFSQHGVPKVIASVVVVGNTSAAAETWLWSWANESFPENVIHEMRKVKEFGVAENLTELSEASSPDDEYFGWAMTAIATRILRAKGAYRCPRDEGGYTYLIYTNLAFADQPSRTLDKSEINCCDHGKGYATYVCEHLIAQPVQKWFSREPNEQNPWPDSWCAACDIFFQEQGAWNEAHEKNLKIKLLCHRCYERIRAQALPAVQ
jgi:hypothetical protein